jgi:mannose-6-phosphate isomerase-like protein (cupin superfamily)
MSRDKEWRFARIVAEAEGFGLEVKEVNKDKPWGGYVLFSHRSLEGFRQAYWHGFLSQFWQDELDRCFRAAGGQDGPHLDAKLLLVSPRERLSLQKHERRSELWRVVEGPVTVVMGEDLATLSDREVRPGEVLKIPRGYLHRLTAPAASWGVVAEFWHHEDGRQPSDEEDIERYDDDYQERFENG